MTAQHDISEEAFQLLCLLVERCAPLNQLASLGLDLSPTQQPALVPMRQLVTTMQQAMQQDGPSEEETAAHHLKLRR